jgi:hypothetical protein
MAAAGVPMRTLQEWMGHRALREGILSATTRPLYVGRTIIVLETELTRQDGVLVAKTTQTQAFHHPVQRESTRADR